MDVHDGQGNAKIHAMPCPPCATSHVDDEQCLPSPEKPCLATHSQATISLTQSTPEMVSPSRDNDEVVVVSPPAEIPEGFYFQIMQIVNVLNFNLVYNMEISTFTQLSARFSGEAYVSLKMPVDVNLVLDETFSRIAVHEEDSAQFDGYICDALFIRDMVSAFQHRVVTVGCAKSNTLLRAFWFARSGSRASVGDVQGLLRDIGSFMFNNWVDNDFRERLWPKLTGTGFVSGETFDLAMFLDEISTPHEGSFSFGIDAVLLEVLAALFKIEIRLLTLDTSLKLRVSALGVKQPPFERHLYLCWNGVPQSPRYFVILGAKVSELVPLRYPFPVSLISSLKFIVSDQGEKIKVSYQPLFYIQESRSE